MSRPQRHLLVAGVAVSISVLAVLGLLRVLLDWPAGLGACVVVATVPLAVAGALSVRRSVHRRAEEILVHSAGGGVAAAVAAALLVVVVVGFGRLPAEGEKSLVVLAIAGTLVAAAAFEPLRRAMTRRLRSRIAEGPDERDSVLKVFGQRVQRDIPLAEVLLQAAEALRRSMALTAAEVWTGRDGHLERTAAVPERAARTLTVDHETSRMAARAGVAGPAWLRVWLPELGASTPGGHIRAVPLGFGGELLGLVVVERDATRDFTSQEEDVLAELGRQMGLTLHNTQLDLALQGTLDEVRRQAVELQASRRRLVQAADGERRRIERDLHDGAQQRLVTLAMNLVLARDMVGDTPAAAVELLDELRRLVGDTVEEVRSLAHGIYPPLLADSGLAFALRAAAARHPDRVTVEADLPNRYPPEVETAVYFCCLEALQNAAKHAPGADVVVRLWSDAGGLLFDVVDDGPGFDVATMAGGQGFTNMADRLGAIGGTIRWESTPGRGTRISGAVPLTVVSR